MKKMGRPPLEDVRNALDLYNLRNDKTQHVKSVKLKESTYNMLSDMKQHNDGLKSLDDVICHLALITASYSMEN